MIFHFFFILHFKTRDIQNFVIHEFDGTRENLWVPEAKSLFLSPYIPQIVLQKNIHGPQNFTHLIFLISFGRLEKRLRTTALERSIF